MTKDIIIECLVEGGKATGGPPIGPALGPTGVPIMTVVTEINNTTSQYEGMKVPVRIIVHPDDKTFTLEIKTPPASALIFKEIGAEKGSAKPNEDKAGNLTIEQAISVAKAKRSSLYAKGLKNQVKTILGTCVSAGVTVEGKDPREVQKAIDRGEYDDALKEEA
ncbi:MAG TPA: 50S ribosomal protein L11 [Candidatus Lokiarchaeia archaeon]|nr:50S ribosomal protein L11 [Candidatus Lokiarchaeia archaeon]